MITKNLTSLLDTMNGLLSTNKENKGIKGSHILMMACFLLLMNACKKFEGFQTDPNRTTQATPDLILSTVEQQAFNNISTGVGLAARQLVNVEAVAPEQYYNWLRADFERYNNLRQVRKMEQEAQRTEKASYAPLTLFFKAWNLYELTLTFGDIPYSEAVQGDDNVFQPKYDTQEQVFIQLLDDLEQANNLLTADMEAVDGDLVYHGDMLKWKKAVNAFMLKILMTLSHKEPHETLRIRERFAAIVGDPLSHPLFENNSDNLALPYYDIAGNRYPYFNNNGIQTAIYMEKTFVDLLKDLQDPRLFRFAAPARSLVNTYGENDPRSYDGVLGSAPNNDNAAQVVTGRISNINRRYYADAVNEPALGLGFAEQQFILAEAVVRGWISGDALAYYRSGVEAAMLFSDIARPSIEDYLAQDQLTSLADGKEVEQIITQKYIASFMMPGWHAFYEQRRTGFPVFDLSGGAVLNGGRVPKRWMYPEDELRLNTVNVEEAIARQYPNGDNINGEMWLIK